MYPYHFIIILLRRLYLLSLAVVPNTNPYTTTELHPSSTSHPPLLYQIHQQSATTAAIISTPRVHKMWFLPLCNPPLSNSVQAGVIPRVLVSHASGDSLSHSFTWSCCLPFWPSSELSGKPSQLCEQMAYSGPRREVWKGNPGFYCSRHWVWPEWRREE